MDERARVAAAVDGVHIVHRRERFPVPGTRGERRAERAVAACFLLTFLGAVAFTVAYVVLPWRYDPSDQAYTWFTPVLGVTMALGLVGIGIGVVLWAKWLIPEEETVQDRHERPLPRARPADRGSHDRRRARDHRHRPPLPAAEARSGCPRSPSARSRWSRSAA